MKLFRWRRKPRYWRSSWGRVSDEHGNLLGLWVDKRPGDRDDFGIILALCAADDKANGRVPLGRIDPDLGYGVVPNRIGDNIGFFVMFACKEQPGAGQFARHQAPGE